MSQRIVEWPYKPRSYQLDLLHALQDGIRRAVCVWHRRAGKDLTGFNYMISQAIQIPGVYFYFFPTYAQGKKILWNGIDGQGRRFLDYIPRECIIGDPHETEMLIKLRTVSGAQSVFQIIGTDNCDSIPGTNPRGVVFSEYSLQNPRGWDLVRPILAENKGWAIFLYTPRGRNHGWSLYENTKGEPGWYVDLRDVTMTFRDGPDEDQTPVMTDADIAAERRTGMDEDLIQQEFFCSFSGAMQGAYFGKLVELAREQGRIRDNLPWDTSRLVNTAWDIGTGDENAIWLWQWAGPMIHLIDYIEDKGYGLPHYAKLLHKREWGYDLHIMPFDVKQREWTTEQQRVRAARQMLGGRVKIAKKVPIDERIDMTRRMFNRFIFSRSTTGRGLDALTSYTKKWDEQRQVFSDTPQHNWASHGAEALCHLCVGFERDPGERPRQQRAAIDFDPMSDEAPRQTQYSGDFDPMEDK